MKRLSIISTLALLIFALFVGCQAQGEDSPQSPSSVPGSPTLQITSPTDGRDTSWGFITVAGIVSPPEAQVNVSGINVDVAEDGSFESDYILLNRGNNELRAVAILDGKTVSKTVTVTYTLKLHVSISLNLEQGKDWFTESPVEIGGRVSDPRAEVIVNGKKAEVGKDGFISVMLELAKGENQITAIAKLADQTDTDTRGAIYVPLAPLTLNTASPEDGSEIGLDLVRVTGTVSDPEAVVTVNNVKTLVTAAGSFYAYVDLDEGENKIAIIAVRGSDNVSDTVKVTYYPPAVPPTGAIELKVTSPQRNSAQRINLLPVTGMVGDSTATVLVDGREAIVSANGSFQGYAVLNEGENVIEVIAFKDTLKTIKNIEVSFTSPLVVLLWRSSSAIGVDYSKEPATFTGKVNKPGAKVTVDGKEVPVAPDGSFTAKVLLSKSSNIKAVATLGDERDEYYVLTGVENGAILTVPGYSIFFRAKLHYEQTITLKAGETRRLPLKLETRKDGPGRFYGSLVHVEREYGLMPLAWPQGLDAHLEPVEFVAYPNTVYDFNLVFKTTPDLARGAYYLHFYYAFENGFRASSWIKVTVE